MQTSARANWVVGAGAVLTLLFPGPASARPDHPVITEVFQNPTGNDGPVDRDPGNLHQEYLELYLPALADLAVGIDKDSLDITLLEIEGDGSNPNQGQVSLRVDLPTFDLDPSNGLTGLPRPPSGIVVLGWVDYAGNPPTGLAGSPATRVALVDGGITNASDFTFIALNGAQFGGTTNFPVPLAVSHLDLTTHPSAGTIAQGSGLLLLLDRDAPGYVSLCDFEDPAVCSSNPGLPTGTSLPIAALFDGFAPNDDNDFDVLLHPFAFPTGLNIDLEFHLQAGGTFSDVVPQLDEQGEGFARIFLDVVKTSEDGIPANEDPVADSLFAYRTVRESGTFAPSPGEAPQLDDPARLEIGPPAAQSLSVLSGTIARPGLLAANIGGDRAMGVQVTAATPTAHGPQIVVAPGERVSTLGGQEEVAPPAVVAVYPGAPSGTVDASTATLTATPGLPGDPPVVDPTGTVPVGVTVIDPKTGLDALGTPFEATAFVAVQGIPAEPGLLNEFLPTSLGQFVAANLFGVVDDERDNGPALINPLTDLSDYTIVQPMIATMPDDPLFLDYINFPGPPGVDDLVNTVLNSAEHQSGADTWTASFDPTFTALKAREFTIAETATSGSAFRTLDRVFYTNPVGRPDDPRSGFYDVNTAHDFELAFIDTHLNGIGVTESGGGDDFGILVEVGQVGPAAPVVPGEFVFLSLSGGLEGADVDSLDVPIGSQHLMMIVYVDLDPLDEILDVKTITRAFVVDADSGSEVNIIEFFSLHAIRASVPEPAAWLQGLFGGAALLGFAATRRREAR